MSAENPASAQPSGGPDRRRPRARDDRRRLRRRSRLLRLLPGDGLRRHDAGRPGRPATKGKRSMTVRFDANVAPGLDWTFEPETASMVTLRTGVTATVFFKVHNLTDHETAASAVYNVQPDSRRRLVRQDFLLLLQRAASRSRRDGRTAGRVFPGSGAREGTRHGRRRHDHAVLHSVCAAGRGQADRPGARDGRGRAETVTNGAARRRRGNHQADREKPVGKSKRDENGRRARQAAS